MIPIEDITAENWLKGEIDEHYQVDFIHYWDEFKHKRISKEEFDRLEQEYYKIRNLKKEAFDAVVANHLRAHIHYFECEIRDVKELNKEDFARFEKEKIERWLSERPELKQAILSDRINYGFFCIDNYIKYIKEKKYWDYEIDKRYSPEDKNIQASLYVKYLNYLDGLNPKKFMTLRDFHTQGEDRYHKDMKLLTEPMEADYENRADDSIPILERRGDEYVFNEVKGYKKYLGAYLLSMVNHGRLDFQGRGKINRDDLSQILINTFKCEKFCKNICHAIINKKEMFFEEKYLDYWQKH
jgi:hypothetical protein